MKDWFAEQLALLVAESSADRVSLAIEGLLLTSKYKPDISEIRAEVFGSADTRVKTAAAKGWAGLRDYARRFVTTDDAGRWVLKARVRILFDAQGQMVFTTDAKGRRVVATEDVELPPMPDQWEFCLRQIGGLQRLMDASDEYLEVVRKDWIAAWGRYGQDREDSLLLPAPNADLLAIAMGGAE